MPCTPQPLLTLFCSLSAATLCKRFPLILLLGFARKQGKSTKDMEHLQTHHHIEPYIQPSRQLPPMANQLPPLIMSSSNVSTSTLDSELVSPDPSQEAHFNAVNASTLKPAVRDSTSPSVTPASGSSTASPRQLVKAPVQVLNVGSKRTATGQLKQSSPTRGAPSHSRDVSKRHSAIEVSLAPHHV